MHVAKQKLSELIKKSDNTKLDLVVQLDYLGFLEIESKYLQNATIQWLLAQIKLFEQNKRINSIFIEINVKKNLLIAYKTFKSSNSLPASSSHSNNNITSETKDREDQKEIFISHKLTKVFKLTCLHNDQFCFGYFYRETNNFMYRLHGFYSNKSNLAQTLFEFQNHALKLYEYSDYANTKIFEYKLIGKVQTKTEKILNYFAFFLNLFFYYLKFINRLKNFDALSQ
jgi:hypothetical protein